MGDLLLRVQGWGRGTLVAVLLQNQASATLQKKFEWWQPLQASWAAVVGCRCVGCCCVGCRNAAGDERAVKELGQLRGCVLSDVGQSLLSDLSAALSLCRH